MKNAVPERYQYLDLLRVICCFFVVLIHASAYYWYSSKINTLAFNFSTFTEILAHFCVPVFYMISGALFLSKKEINMKKIYTKNILNIIIILLIWLPIYGIANYYRYGGTITGFSSLITIAQNVIDNQFQFWFLFPLLTIYICLPIYKKIAEDKKVLKYFLILFFIFQILKPTFGLIFGTGYKMKVINLFTPAVVLGYGGYFLLGYYLHSTDFSKITRKVVYALSILSIFIGFFATIYLTNKNGVKYEGLFNYYTLPNAITSVGIFLLLKYHKFKEKGLTKFFTKLSPYTMGVYVLHMILFWYLIESFINIFKLPLIVLPVATILIFALSIIITIIIKRLPIIGKYLV